VYRYEWRILNAAGEGSASGSTGRWRIPDWEPEDVGNRGSAEHWAAMTMLCTGNMNTCSLADGFEDATASTWVGYVGCPEDDERAGMESAWGTCDLGMEVGICEEGREEIPASIC